MSKFGKVDKSETSFEEYKLYKNQTLTSASNGVSLIHTREGQVQSDEIEAALTVSGSHWAFIHNYFYRSGSSRNNPDEVGKFDGIYHKFNEFHDLKPFYINKFHSSASVLYIPQIHIGDSIKTGSFQLVARTGSASNASKQIIIKDDGNGNLYSTNAHANTGSFTSPISSSENYVGNIFYDLGVVTVTETGSWSGSVNYMDIGNTTSDDSKTYRYWDFRYESTVPMYTSEYTITVKAGQFNSTLNNSSIANTSTSSNFITELTTGSFSPYFNQIQLYRHRDEEPIFIANLPKPVKTFDDVDLVITFRMDQ